MVTLWNDAGNRKEGRFIAYPRPNRVIWFRDLDFTGNGKVGL